MKNILFFLFLFLPLLAPAQTIENPGFERLDTATTSGFAGWQSRRQYELAPDSTTHKQGRYALRMSSIDGKNFGSFMQEVPFPTAAALRKIRFSGRIKREDVDGFTGIWLELYEGDKTVFFDNMYTSQLKGSVDWVTVDMEFFAGPKTTKAYLGGLLVGDGVVWFDDFSLTEIPLPSEPLPDSLRTYLLEVADTLQRHALNRDSVDWPAVRERMLQMSAGSTSYADCYPALRYAIGQLGDHHSFLMPAEESRKWAEPAAGEGSAKDFEPVTGRMLDGGIAYLSMPAFSAGDEQTCAAFAQQTQDLLRKLDRSRPRGWILDLRNNGGGNCWPMLAGIGPLLGEGVCGYFLAPGESPASWFYQKGGAGIGTETITRVKRPVRLHKAVPRVAVLTGPRTGSSGEVVAVAFRQRPNTRSFGAPTAGLSTGNANYRLRDGAQIFLTGSVYADRTMAAYGKRLAPDEAVSGGEGAADPVVEAAKKWLALR